MDKILLKLRMLYRKTFPLKRNDLKDQLAIQMTGDEAQNYIQSRLNNDSPLMIARFGSTEMDCLTKYHHSKKNGLQYVQYIQGKIDSYGIDDLCIRSMSQLSGFFPSNKKALERFANLMLEDIKLIDVLGSWLPGEKYFKNELINATRIRLRDIEPYYFENPWSSALKGKKVLVIHPFTNSIKEQYSKRSLLFTNPDVLPEFELKTIKAVQSIANNETGFANWFDALQFMKDQITNEDFDIAIIGCGAYGLPLAAHVKRSGKKAIHMGGASQILFGVKGKRWEEHKTISTFINEHWKRPSTDEVPEDFRKVEDGCYW